MVDVFIDGILDWGFLVGGIGNEGMFFLLLVVDGCGFGGNRMIFDFLVGGFEFGNEGFCWFGFVLYLVGVWLWGNLEGMMMFVGGDCWFWGGLRDIFVVGVVEGKIGGIGCWFGGGFWLFVGGGLFVGIGMGSWLFWLGFGVGVVLGM